MEKQGDVMVLKASPWRPGSQKFWAIQFKGHIWEDIPGPNKEQ
jgi:hypothetical protein